MKLKLTSEQKEAITETITKISAMSICQTSCIEMFEQYPLVIAVPDEYDNTQVFIAENINDLNNIIVDNVENNAIFIAPKNVNEIDEIVHHIEQIKFSEIQEYDNYHYEPTSTNYYTAKIDKDNFDCPNIAYENAKEILLKLSRNQNFFSNIEQATSKENYQKIQEEIAKIWFVASVNDIENPKCLTTIDFNGNVKTISYQDFVNDLNHYEMNPPYTITTQGVSIYIEKDDFHLINQLENHLPLFTHCVYNDVPNVENVINQNRKMTI